LFITILFDSPINEVHDASEAGDWGDFKSPRGREVLLVHLLGIVFDHVARLPGGCCRLGIGTSGSKQEHDCGLSQAMEHEPPLTQRRHFWLG
jgi:hypothetical protein